jgi:hypothetical protein
LTLIGFVTEAIELLRARLFCFPQLAALANPSLSLRRKGVTDEYPPDCMHHAGRRGPAAYAGQVGGRRGRASCSVSQNLKMNLARRTPSPSPYAAPGTQPSSTPFSPILSLAMSIEKTATTVQQPLLDLDGAPRPRRPRASKLTPRRFCLGLCALVSLGIIGFLGVKAFLAVKNIWSTIGQTHVESHWNATAAGAVAGDEHIVRPYFGLKEDGAAVERFDLAATIYVRFNKEAADLEAAGYEPDESKWLAGWKDIPGRVLNNERRRGRFIPIFREIVLRDVPVYSKPIKTTARVVIPKELL